MNSSPGLLFDSTRDIPGLSPARQLKSSGLASRRTFLCVKTQHGGYAVADIMWVLVGNVLGQWWCTPDDMAPAVQNRWMRSGTLAADVESTDVVPAEELTAKGAPLETPVLGIARVVSSRDVLQAAVAASADLAARNQGDGSRSELVANTQKW